MKKVVYLLLSLLVFSGCLKNDELKLKTKDYQPQLLNDGYPDHWKEYMRNPTPDFTIPYPHGTKDDLTSLLEDVK